MNNNIPPGLFGIKNSNRNFLEKFAWGKNQFNNTFPAALACYMSVKRLDSIYIKLNKDLSTFHDKIAIADVFGIDPGSPNLFFAFEHEFKPYKKFASNNLPRVDLVTKKIKGGNKKYLRPLEVKLTALPDDQTSEETEDNYGSEIVVRPDTVVYLALSIIELYQNKKDELLQELDSACNKNIDWTNAQEVILLIPDLTNAINNIVTRHLDQQKPLLMQPVWKTRGKSTVLADNCLDIFIWSDFAFTRLFIDLAGRTNREVLTRPLRSVVWLSKMLHQYAKKGKVNPKKIIDTMTYNTRNDKAFALGGKSTRIYMKSPELTTPRVKKEEIRNIILGGGEKYLSPERRFDGVVQNTLDLFS